MFSIVILKSILRVTKFFLVAFLTAVLKLWKPNARYQMTAPWVRLQQHFYTQESHLGLNS